MESCHYAYSRKQSCCRQSKQSIAHCSSPALTCGNLASSYAQVQHPTLDQKNVISDNFAAIARAFTSCSTHTRSSMAPREVSTPCTMHQAHANELPTWARRSALASETILGAVPVRAAGVCHHHTNYPRSDRTVPTGQYRYE